MLLPVAGADLVADQGVTGALVRDAQQGFGQAHQRHAFLGGQGELLQQALDDAGAAAGALLVAQLLGDAIGELVAGLGHLGGQASLLQQHGYGFLLGAAVGGGDGGAEHGLRQDAFGEIEERLVGGLGQGVERVVVTLGQAVGDALEFRQGHAAFQALEVAEDRLLDQPVRGALDLARSFLETIAGCLVQFHAKGGARSHFLSSFQP
ncbi:hypothetical protein D3C81_1571490 [compost metagenome]